MTGPGPAASFVFDANRCTGCGACRVACTIENGLAPDVSWRRIDTFNPRRHPLAPLFHLSIACNHCADAACMSACPALAYARDAGTGAVLIDQDRCIGCGYCTWACPYDAPVFDEQAGVMSKCTWCADRLRAGLTPACATHCPTAALDFAEVPEGERVLAIEGLPQTTLRPRLHVVPLAPGRRQPEMTAGEVAHPVATPSPSPGGSDISLKKEWPLAVFTLSAAALVAVFKAAQAGALAIDARVFAVAAAAAMGLASAHLGRKARAWRAMLNVRRSWLSREIVTLSVFFGLATLWLAFAPGRPAPGAAIALVGFAGLFAADSVYAVLPAGPGYRHSASVLWAGLLVAAIAGGEPEIGVLVGAAKLYLYVARKRRFAASGRPLRPVLSVLRGGVGLVLPFALWTMGPAAYAAAVALVVFGEVVDRVEYYLELERESPRRQMGLALSRRLAEQERSSTARMRSTNSPAGSGPSLSGVSS